MRRDIFVDWSLLGKAKERISERAVTLSTRRDLIYGNIILHTLFTLYNIVSIIARAGRRRPGRPEHPPRCAFRLA